MKNKGKTKTPPKTKVVLLFLGTLSVKVFLFSVGTLFVLVIIYNLTFVHHNCASPCSFAESDANNIAATIADYFAIPEQVNLPTIAGDSVYPANPYPDNFVLSNKGGQNIAWVSEDPHNSIRIVVQDTSGKCPKDYMKHWSNWDHNNSTFTRIMDRTEIGNGY
jgi:hypothetical protein